MWHCWPKICVIKKIMWYSILRKSSFFIVLEFHTVECLIFLFFFFPFFSKALALLWNLSSQRKWQAFMAKVSSILAKRKEAWIWFACQVLFLAIFFDNSWRTFNASSCISSRMKLLEYHASSWHGHASHLMVCWLMSSH